MSLLQKEAKRFAVAVKGFILFIRTGTHAKFHFVSALLVLIAGSYFHITGGEWVSVCLCIGFVMSAEAFNTSIEMLCDFVHAERHPAIGNIKDMAAAAVLIACVTAAVAGCIIFIPYILKL